MRGPLWHSTGLQDCDDISLLGPDQCPSVSRIAGFHDDVGNAASQTEFDLKHAHGLSPLHDGNAFVGAGFPKWKSDNVLWRKGGFP